MSLSSAIEGRFIAALHAARCEPQPFAHWLLKSPLDPAVAEEMAALPLVAPEIGDTNGRRETNNATRLFLDGPCQTAHPVCRALAEAFQSSALINAIAGLTSSGFSAEPSIYESRGLLFV